MAYSTAMRKKSPYAKKGGANRGSLKRAAPVTMAALQRYVRKVTPPPEVKYARFQADEVAMNTLSASVSFTELSGPAQGTGGLNRVGNEILAKSMHVTGVIRNNSNSTTWVRGIIVGFGPELDTADPELFMQLSSGTPSTPLTITGLNMIYTPLALSKVKVFWDRRFKVGGSTTLDGSDTQFFNKKVNLNDKKIKFDGTLAGEGNQTYRYAVVFLCATADDDSIGTTLELSYQSEFGFTDP